MIMMGADKICKAHPWGLITLNFTSDIVLEIQNENINFITFIIT